MPQTEWEVSDDRRLRAQLQNIQDFVYAGYHKIEDFLTTSDYTTGTNAIDNGLPSIRLTNSVDRIIASNHTRPQFWTYGKCKIHVFFWTNNVLAAQTVRINLTVSVTHPGEIAPITKVTLAETVAVPTTAWEVFEVKATSTTATGYAVDTSGMTHEHCVLSGEVEREGSHGGDNYASNISFLCAQLEFIPASPVAD